MCGQCRAVVSAFTRWLRGVVRHDAHMAEMVRGLLGGYEEEAVVLIGTHWIIPKVNAQDGGTQQPQPMHTDIPTKGELLSIAMHAYGLSMVSSQPVSEPTV